MSKKFAKKSPVGSRVAAIFSDEYYAPATIESIKPLDGGDVYVIKFDGEDKRKECYGEDMIGANFNQITDVKLRPFQKTYTTHNGREISAYFHSYKDGQLLLSIPAGAQEKQLISRSPSEVRLIDKRRSQRLQQSTPMDYRKMVEEGSPNKGRSVSASIEVPKTNRIRKTSEEPTMTELMAAMVLSNLSCSPVFHNPPVQNLKGSSPQSFGSSGVGSWRSDAHHLSPSRQARSSPGVSRPTAAKTEDVDDDSGEHPSFLQQPPPSPEDPIDADSGMILIDRTTTPTSVVTRHAVKVESEDELPDEPQDLRVPKLRLPAPIKEEAEEDRSSASYSISDRGSVPMEEETQKVDLRQETIPIPRAIPVAIRPGIPVPYYFAPSFLPQQYVASLPVQLASTPPPPGNSAPGYIESKMHRHLHRAAPYHKDDSSIPSPAGGSSPSTITFGSAPAGYYFPGSPIPVSSLSFSPTHKVRQQTRSPLTAAPPTSQSACRSLPQSTPSAPISVPAGFAILRDHPYQTAVAQPINIPGTKAFSWHNSRPAYTTKSPVIYPHMRPSTSPKPPFALSPKSISIGVGRKVRGDGKKCRKVYGMENREMWCTACRWKKACQRFPD